MTVEAKTELNAAEIKEIVKEELSPETEIREMIKEYDQLDGEEKLIVDSYYFTRAANVTDGEARMFYESLAKGERVFPEIIDKDHQIFCPIHRMRLKVLGKEAQKIYRCVVWGE